jgi:hypothetical protein
MSHFDFKPKVEKTPAEIMAHLSIGNQALVETVALGMNVTIADIFSKKRPARIALARQICVTMIYGDGSGAKLVEVGAMFDRDHGTVIHAKTKIIGLLRAGDDDLAKLMADGYRARTMQTPRHDWGFSVENDERLAQHPHRLGGLMMTTRCCRKCGAFDQWIVREGKAVWNKLQRGASSCDPEEQKEIEEAAGC